MIRLWPFKIPDLFFRLAGLLLLILAWELLARSSSKWLIASPGETLRALFGLLGDREFITTHMLSTLKRIALALTLGIFTGCFLGVFAGLQPKVRLLLAPLRWMLMSVPAVVIVVVFMLWFGMGTTMVVGLTATLISPIVYVNLVEGMKSVDRDLIEMSRIYGFSFSMRLRRIYGPVLAGPFFSGVVIATGNGIRVVVLAELLGAQEGLGHALAVSRTNLDTPNLYALALLSMLIVGAVEFVLLRPARAKIKRKGS